MHLLLNTPAVLPARYPTSVLLTASSRGCRAVRCVASGPQPGQQQDSSSRDTHDALPSSIDNIDALLGATEGEQEGPSASLCTNGTALSPSAACLLRWVDIWQWPALPAEAIHTAWRKGWQECAQPSAAFLCLLTFPYLSKPSLFAWA